MLTRIEEGWTHRRPRRARQLHSVRLRACSGGDNGTFVFRSLQAKAKARISIYGHGDECRRRRMQWCGAYPRVECALASSSPASREVAENEGNERVLAREEDRNRDGIEQAMHRSGWHGWWRTALMGRFRSAWPRREVDEGANKWVRLVSGSAGRGSELGSSQVRLVGWAELSQMVWFGRV